MNRWPKLFGLFLIILIWLFFISLPMLAFALAARQQIQVGGEATYMRLTLLQDKDAEGISVEISRPSSFDPACRQISVRYFMWTGEPENVDFCHCIDPQTGYTLPAVEGSCTPP
jgi:hypothetical protein